MKKKKEMNPEKKEFLKTLFGSLINNERAINGAKTSKWWIGALMGLLAIILPVIPITVNNARTYGSSFLASYSYGFDKCITASMLSLSKGETVSEDESLNNKKIEFKVNSNNELQMFVGGSDTATTRNDNKALIAVHNYVATYAKGQENEYQEYQFQIFYTSGSIMSKNDDFSVKSLAQNLDGTVYTPQTTTKAPEKLKDGEYYTPSHLVLGKDGLYISLRAEHGTKQVAYYSAWSKSDYKHFKKNVDIVEESLNVKIDTIQSVESNDFVKAVLGNWKTYFNLSYKTYRVQLTLIVSGACLGGYALLILIFGFILWLVTRGKRNMFNYLKFGTTFEIALWCSLAPAILALAGGFIYAPFAMFYFIIFMGIRMMWLVMRQLRPVEAK